MSIKNIEFIQTEFSMPKLKRFIIFVVTVIFIITFLTYPEELLGKVCECRGLIIAVLSFYILSKCHNGT